MCRGFATRGKARGKAALRAKARGLPWAKPRDRGEATRARRNSVRQSRVMSRQSRV